MTNAGMLDEATEPLLARGCIRKIYDWILDIAIEGFLNALLIALDRIPDHPDIGNTGCHVLTNASASSNLVDIVNRITLRTRAQTQSDIEMKIIIEVHGPGVRCR